MRQRVAMPGKNLKRLLRLWSGDCPSLYPWIEIRTYVSADIVNDKKQYSEVRFPRELLEAVHRLKVFSLIVDVRYDNNNEQICRSRPYRTLLAKQILSQRRSSIKAYCFAHCQNHVVQNALKACCTLESCM